MQTLLEAPAQPLGIDVIDGGDEVAFLDQEADILTEQLRRFPKLLLIVRSAIGHLYQMGDLSHLEGIGNLDLFHARAGVFKLAGGLADSLPDAVAHTSRKVAGHQADGAAVKTALQMSGPVGWRTGLAADR